MTRSVRRLVLVGFMGSGKSTVAPMVARALGWEALDFDDVIVQRTGSSVSELFIDLGEAGFRRLEAAVGVELLGRDEVVLSPGGGWAAEPGRLDDLPIGTVSVWLKVAADESVRRVLASGHRRPLLDAPAPIETARTLLAERVLHYASAQHEVDTTGLSPEDVTRQIVSIIRPTDL